MAKEIKVCFISHHFRSPVVYLEQIRKMTPGKSCKWKDMTAVTDPMQADFCVVFDGINPGLQVPLERVLYFGEHPDVSPAYSEWVNEKALAKYPMKKFLNPGEWWLDYDYDYLKNLQRPAKSKELVCVFTGHTHNEMYRRRRSWITNFCEYHKTLDLFGRPVENFINDPILKKYHKGCLGVAKPVGPLGEHQTGKEHLIEYKYSIEFDVGPTTNYISERFYDAMLLWVMPFYYGSTNVHQYLPEASFRYINIDQNGEQVTRTIQIGYYEQHIAELTAARDMLLDQYQIWPYCYRFIKEFAG